MSYSFDFSFLLTTWPAFMRGAWQTILLAGTSIALGFVVALVCAIIRSGKSKLASGLVGAYVEVIRNTPLLVQIFIVYFGLPSLGLRLSAETAAVIALVINTGAYGSEIIRAGIESIAKGQIEAAECLGLNKLQIYWHIVLIPAVERVYPALSSQFVLLMLSSSITSQISAQELTAEANLIQSETFRSFEVYLIVAAVYLALSVLFRVVLWAIGEVAFVRRRKLRT
ncbi:amino acid ABC transporter permease [Kaistia defluvii]|uniref:amino acid ABC transporter permease n=1 Tax=Kaistia defluvii TaxID=410841 RepID=UPI002259718D|nr:amino acid ABC transporter permease [Kaistia defluvii]MCX5518266.1 amino acid ABC transporter permease [Kaistia defluvii]